MTSRSVKVSTSIFIAIAAVALALYPRPAVAQSQPPSADYRLQNDLTSSVGTAPALQPVGPGTGAFATETVGGASRTVFTFPAGNGLSLGNTSGVVPNDVYTIAVLFRFENLLGYRRIIDFKNGASDAGVYNYDGHLNFFPSPQGTSVAFTRNQYAQVVITRDAAANVVGYVDGVQEFTFVDTGEAAFIDFANILNFFKDDNAVDSEESAGAAARIRLWGSALTSSEVAALDDNQSGASPSPSPSPTEPSVQKIEAQVTIKYNGKYFNGYVRPGDGGQGFARQTDPADLCDNSRQVRIKHEEPGADPIVGKDISGYEGYYRVVEDAVGGDVYYSIVKRKTIELDSGETIICARTESKHLRAPRQ